MRLRYSALSDVGRVRRDNQDSGYAGPHLLVVADGVGGSARGDIASSATVEELRRLDVPPTEEMLGALAGAIHRSHSRIAALVADDPDLEGTSSTVTAVSFDGSSLAVGHVGDSRGYLLRDGVLSQLTTDHTFVQSLIDEGRITEDEARVHPHRNLILRAVDGVHDPEPDVFTVEAALGDRVLLCSDGCSGVLNDDDLARVLGDGTPDHAAVALVSAALDAGSSDNVTVVVADLVADDAVDDDETSAASLTGPMLVGAAAEGPRSRGGGTGRPARGADTGELDPVPAGAAAAGATSKNDLDPEEARYAPQPPRRFTWVRRLGVLAVIIGLVLIVAVAGYRWTQDQYFVGQDGDVVVIYRGIEADLPGISTHEVEERSDLAVDDLPTYNARQVREGIGASSLEDARGIVSRLERRVLCPEPAVPTPSASPTGTPRPGASATPRNRQRSTSTPSPSPSASPTTAPCTEAP